MRPLLSGRHGGGRDAYVPPASGEDRKCGHGGNVNGLECGGIYQEPYQRVSAPGVSGCGCYRMLTLNTGQTPMSPRHQLEMLYSDMLNTEVNGVKLIREVEGTANADKKEFIFKNTIDGFNSYMSRNALPMDREEMLENIKMLEKMSKENISVDIFK